MDSNRKTTSAALLIVSSSKVYSFENPVIKIGRLEDNDLIIDDPRVSRNHAELRFHDGRYMIVDLGSTGGTFVNGVKVDRQILDKGDVITLSGIHLVFGQDEFPQAESTSRYISPDTKPQANLNTRTLSPDTVRLKKPDEDSAGSCD